MLKLTQVVAAMLLVACGVYADPAEVKEADANGCMYAPIAGETKVLAMYPITAGGIIVDDQPTGWSELAPGGAIVNGDTLNSFTDVPYLLASNAEYEVPATGSLQLSTTMSFVSSLAPISGPVSSPLGPNQDPYYGMGFFGAVNLAEGWTLGFAVTNQKIYALYSHIGTGQTILNNYIPFSYFVPLTSRTTAAIDSLGLVIDAANKLISYRTNGFEFLRITKPGYRIDQKFQTGAYAGSSLTIEVPSIVQVAIAVTRPTDPGIPHTVCQRTNFNACLETIENSTKALCQYAPIQDPASFLFELSATFGDIAVLEQSTILSCYHSGCPYNCGCSSSSSDCRRPPPSSCCEPCCIPVCGCSSSSSCTPPPPPPSSSTSECDICIPASSSSRSCEPVCNMDYERLARRGFIFPA